MSLLSDRLRLVGKSFVWLGAIFLTIGAIGVSTEHLDQTASCHETFDSEMVSSIVSLEGYQLGSTVLPLGGFYCEYSLVDGGTYVSTTSWANTVLVILGSAGIVLGVSLFLVRRSKGFQASGRSTH